MMSNDQDMSLGSDAQGQDDQPSLHNHGNTPVDAEMTPLNALKNESPPTTPILKSVAIAPPPPAAISGPELNRPASQKSSIQLNPALSVLPQASGLGDTQLQLHDPKLYRHTSQIAGGQREPTSQNPSNEQPVHKLDPPPKGAPASLDQLTAFWEKYNAIGDKEDKEFVASAGGDLDNLLIFAGLFSAIDTAFIIESYKALKPDPADESTKLLRSVVLLLRDPTYTGESVTASFTATARDVRINCLLFTSLCCSLSAAFGAVLAKQWLTQYDQDGGGSLKTPATRGRERQQKYEGRGRWRLDDVIVTLPTLLQFSLFFFFIGLADFVWPLNTPVASIVIAFTAATFLFYSVTISISVVDLSAPFQTRLSALLIRISVLVASIATSVGLYIQMASMVFYLEYVLREPFWKWIYGAFFTILIKPIPYIFITAFKHRKAIMAWFTRMYHSITTLSPRNKEVDTPPRSVESRCVVHLLERMTVAEDLDILAEAVELLPDTSGASELADALATFHLKPTRNGFEWLFPSLHDQSRGAITKILRTMLGKWEHSELDPSSIRYVQMLDNSRMREALLLQLWDTFLAHPEDQDVYDSIRQVYLKLSRGESDPTRTSSKQFLSRDGVKANLKAGAAQECTFRLVCLLPTIGCDTDNTLELLRTATSESLRLVYILQSTMWEAPGHKPDLELFWLATIRAETLSSCLDILADSHFPEYLATWFNHFAIPDWEARFPVDQSSFRHSQAFAQQRSLYWTYLFSLRHLLKDHQSKRWSQELAATGHLLCLRVILQGYPHDDHFCAEPLGLWALLCLWSQQGVQIESNRSPFLTNDCVQLVTKSVESCGSRTGWIAEMAEADRSGRQPRIWTSLEKVAEDVVDMLGWLFAYLEAAKEGGLLDEGVAESMIQAYSGWWTEVNTLLPEGQQRRDRSDQLRAMLLGNVSV